MQEVAGIRERRREATWAALHDAGAELTLKRGLTGVSVEDIAAAAGCSRRTFFNYFPTKEDAVLGLREVVFTDAEFAEVVQRSSVSDSPLERVLAVLQAVLDRTLVCREQHARRKRLVALEPALNDRFGERMRSLETVVVEALQRLDGETSTSGEGLDRVEAQVLAFLAGAVFRYSAFSDPEGFAADRSQALERAATTFRKVIEQRL